MTSRWIPDFYAHHPAFAALAPAARELDAARWPDCDDLNRVIAFRDPPVVNAAGMPLSFVPQSPPQREFADKYEPRAYLRGEVQFRAGGWHDVFNALMWLTFPQAKAALNERHFHALKTQGAQGQANRAPLQDALTLFDESGVIVATADLALGELLKAHAWKELFCRRRADVIAKMRFYLFGHGLAEKMLDPFVGVTGRGLIVQVDDSVFGSSFAEQLGQLDARIAARIADQGHPLGVRDLTAVPLLGIPGWCADNADERYYDNAAYFRPRRAS